MTPRTVVLLAKRDRFCVDAVELARRAFGGDLAVFQGSFGDTFPLTSDMPNVRTIISFLSPWIVPAWALSKVRLAINFHPGPVEYPGIGCYNFAIYEQATVFGAVCHHMAAKVDTGPIVAESRFPMGSDETVEQLKLRTMIAMSAMFADVIDVLATGKPLPRTTTQWTRRPYTRSELNELCILEPGMNADERQRRIRATTHPGYPGPQERQPDGTMRALPVPSRAPIA